MIPEIKFKEIVKWDSDTQFNVEGHFTIFSVMRYKNLQFEVDQFYQKDAYDFSFFENRIFKYRYSTTSSATIVDLIKIILYHYNMLK